MSDKELLTTNTVVCPDCKNTFLQPFVCTTCGAEKLYDATVRNQAATIDRLTAERDRLRVENASLCDIGMELATYADHTFSCAIAEEGSEFDSLGHEIDCTCGYSEAVDALARAASRCQARAVLEAARADTHSGSGSQGE